VLANCIRLLFPVLFNDKQMPSLGEENHVGFNIPMDFMQNAFEILQMEKFISHLV